MDWDDARPTPPKSAGIGDNIETLSVAELEALDFKVLPSAANFVFARHSHREGAELAAKLRERSIIIRHFKNPARISPYLRITIGTDEQTRRLVQALREILQSGAIV